MLHNWPSVQMPAQTQNKLLLCIRTHCLFVHWPSVKTVTYAQNISGNWFSNSYSSHKIESSYQSKWLHVQGNCFDGCDSVSGTACIGYTYRHKLHSTLAAIGSSLAWTGTLALTVTHFDCMDRDTGTHRHTL